jgi:hypothetical protein
MARKGIASELQDEWGRLVESAGRETSGQGGRPGNAMRVSGRVAFAELEDLRQSWRELLSSPIVRTHAGRYVNAAWTLRDLLAHMASWISETQRETETISRGEQFDYVIPFAMSVIGPNQWNEAEVQERRPRSLEEIRAEYEAGLDALQELVLGMPEKRLNEEWTFPLAPSGHPASRWKGGLGGIVVAQCMHQRYHLARIGVWLSKRASRRW